MKQLFISPSRTLLITEFFLLFILLPISGYFLRYEIAPYLLLCITSLLLFCLIMLLADCRFKRFRFWNIEKLKKYLPVVLKSFFFAALFMTFLSWYYTPEWLFSLPAEQTYLWLGLLVLYPLLSAWPQEIIFRTFMFHRYKRVFKSKSLRAYLSASSFALAHLLFANWIAVVGSFFAGLVFAFTYIKSRSTLLVALEHSLWGCWLFTAGLGIHFDSSLLN